MVFTRFRMHLLARIALLCALLVATLWSLLRTGWDATPVVCGALALAALVELIHFVERATRDFTRMLQAIAGGDFTSALPPRRLGVPFKHFEAVAAQLIGTYRRLDLDRAASDELLAAVLEHVGAAVICLSATGRIVLANRAARDLLGAPARGSVDALGSLAPQLPMRLLALRDGERAQVDVTGRTGNATLLLHARRFTLLDEALTAVICHDIHEELESRDVAAWQALTRVLTHEMMNSLTPIMTLSRLARDKLDARRAAGSPDIDEDVAESIEVIHERSSGLAEFIQAYRRFSNPPMPQPENISSFVLLNRIAHLLAPELGQHGIELRVTGRDTLINVDAHQLEQVLINLARNARQAQESRGRGTIELHSDRDDLGRAILEVIDDGPGIPKELLGQIFIPFFTTRTGGTGIGLSLSRQLVQLNGGAISVRSGPEGCRFTLRLPAGNITQPFG